MKKNHSKRNPLLLFVILLCCIFTSFAQVPVITSFSPTSAKPGDAVTLTGTNFNATPGNNIVFFGATRATVMAASAISVTVTVPSGATYAPITLLNTSISLAASSVRNFTPTYSPAKIAITASDFQAKQDFTAGTQPRSVAVGDLDGDGKPELVVANGGLNTVSVYRNTSVSGSIGSGSFAAPIDFTTGSGPVSVAIGDLDGDGKPELAVANYSSNSVSVIRNLSSSGSIVVGSFAAKVDFVTGAGPISVGMGDLDGDGKPDLVVANEGSYRVSIFRNTATSGSIGSGSFAAKVDFTPGSNPYSVAIGDLDGDGKPDLVVANYHSNSVSVFRNIATSGSINTGSFAAKVDFATGSNPNSVALGDLDGDGKSELAVVNGGSNTVSVLRNTSSSGTVSFIAKVDFTTGTSPVSVAMGDLDGDGKPELAVANVNSNTVSVYRNTSSSGSIVLGSFAAKVDLATGSFPWSIALGDLDGDGKPELAVANDGSATVSVLRNADIPPPIITSFIPVSAKPGDAVILTGSNFNVTASNNIVFFGATRATVTAASATSVTVTVPSGATYAPLTLLNTNNSLAASSVRNFTPTYSPAKIAITVTDFQAKQDFTSGSLPRSVAVGDLDGDGKPDLVVANESSNTVSVYRNTSSSGSVGSGSFAAKVDFTTGVNPQSVAIGDLDGDGKLDLAVANYGSNSVSVIRNLSSSGSIVLGSFAVKVDFTTGTNPQSVALGDLDGDGKPDLAVANLISNTVSVIRNLSMSGSINSGSFAAKVDFTTGINPYSVAIGDLDGDGKPELAVANNASVTVSVFRNTTISGSIGAGSFAAKVDFATGFGPRSVAMGDLDGDGKPDLAVANSGSATVSVFRNTSSSGSIGAGSFAAKVDFATGTAPSSVDLGDLDGDGKPELAVANLGSNTVSVIRNTATSGSIGSGSFAATVDFATGTNPFSVALGDLDGDGKPELTAANYGSNTVSVLRNSDLPPVITSFSPTSAKPGDAVTLTGTNFNATPGNNIVFFGATSASVTAASAISVTVTVPSGATYAPIALLNTGIRLAASSVRNFTPTYSPAKTALTATDFQAEQDFATGTNPQSVAVGDLDGDGKPDLVVANFGSATVSVYRNTSVSGSIGSGSFAAKVDFTTGTQPISVALGDLDGDGKPELAVANYFSNSVSVFRNTATSGSIVAGSFAAKVDFTTGLNPISVALGDLDGDGKPDLAVANFNSATVSVFRNTSSSGSIGTGSFAIKADFTAGAQPRSVALGDLDGDGKPDLAVANFTSATVSVFRNTATSGSIGIGSFAAKVDFTTGTQPYSVATGDLDGDGKPDLAVANYSSNTVSVFRNIATSGSINTGSFTAKVDFTTGTGSVSVALGDLDGDGKPELAVANLASNTVSVFRNTATSGSIVLGSFAAKVDFSTGLNPYSVALGDLDGDGKPDLAVANDGSATVSVLRNADIPPPTITSFTPLSAKPGDAVILTGTNFNTAPANNIVFFGATRATVTAASAISVTVTVPSGATYAPITLLNTASSLAASSVRNFTPTYSPAKTAITATDFQAKQDFATGTNPQSIAVGDLDGDGKPDLAVANLSSNTVSVYRNTSSNGSIGSGSFAAKVDFTTGLAPRSVAIGDLDGDGKPDLAIANLNSSTVSVFRNTATSGSIVAGSFAAKVDFNTGAAPSSVALGDLDGDGKPELAVANSGSDAVSVFRNTSNSGSIVLGSFAAPIDFTTGLNPRSVALGDLDGDGKPDLAVANNGSATVSVFRNTSSSGSIVAGSFAVKVDFTTGTNPISVALGDLDGDGKPELAVANVGSATISVFRNTATSGGIVLGSFVAKVDFTTGSNPISVVLGDLDGDGKPELAVANISSHTVSVFRNTAMSGSIGTGSFAAKVDFTTGTQPRSVALGDLDGDGKPDLAVANSASNTVSVLRNRDIIAMSISSGAWNNPSTWNVNRIPLSSESVIIDQNHTVDITTAVSAKAIEYRNNAKLSFTNALSKLTIGL